MADLAKLHATERALLHLAAQAGLPEPDTITYREEDDEVELIWHDRKLVVIVECGEGRSA